MRDKYIKNIIASIYSTKQQFGCRLKGSSLSLTLAEWKILSLLQDKDCMSTKELSKQSSVSASATSQTLKKLEKAHYIKRMIDKNDKRLTHIKATPKAKRALNSAETCMISDMACLFSTLTDNELKTLAKLHRKIANSIKNQVCKK